MKSYPPGPPVGSPENDAAVARLRAEAETDDQSNPWWDGRQDHPSEEDEDITMASYRIEWKASGPNHTRNESYGQAEWNAACEGAGVEPDAVYSAEAAAQEALDAIDAALDPACECGLVGRVVWAKRT